MFWGCVVASGTGCLDCVHDIMKSEDYQIILECNVGPSVRKLDLRQRSWVFQQDNDPKHSSKSTQKWFKTKRWRVLKWPAMSPDLNPIEHLWRDLKTAVGRRHPSNLRHLETLMYLSSCLVVHRGLPLLFLFWLELFSERSTHCCRKSSVSWQFLAWNSLHFSEHE